MGCHYLQIIIIIFLNLKIRIRYKHVTTLPLRPDRSVS
nr:MAG TPA: hypothetical protein [Caudoviricetes sp.]DAN24758.1 MAG TPA: hypothetical protein [Caudoviricetes sp.]DAO09437.1 MAG TPA: hypothetical protein [Caudoviricetes sp.]DAP97294.1 MAG TPA: hypothetical protein [Caudoviricetes sp.]